VAQRAERTPERQLLVDDHGRRITFGEYRDACERTAAGLAEQGIASGSIVSWQLPTWLESVVLVGALARLGAVQNPLLPIYRERELRFITRQLEPSLLVVPSSWNGVEYAAMARSVSSDDGGFDVLVCDREMPLPEGDPGTLPAFAPPASETVRWVFYTSGTTADPKGVKHTDASVIAAALGPIDATQMNADDRSAVVFPLTHIGGVLSVVHHDLDRGVRPTNRDSGPGPGRRDADRCRDAVLPHVSRCSARQSR
jgi:acyl-CoA synthetase (AMP-forming)/AMP-acid ligase II